MAKDDISQYSTTAASNTDVGGVNINEDCLPSNLNNAIRELMSHLADLNAGNTSLGTIKVDNLQLDLNTISSTDTNGNINITPNGTGSVIIDGLSFPQADGTADQILKTNGSGQISFGDAPSGFSLGTALSGTTPTIDWSSATAFTHTLSGNTTYSFSNVPSGGAIELFLKNVGIKDNYLQSVNGFESTQNLWSGVTDASDVYWIEHMVFNNDGTRVWIFGYKSLGLYGSWQFSLSTAYDLSTATFDTGKYNSNLNGSFLVNCARAGTFNTDGTKYIGVDVNDLYAIKDHTVSTAYDITTLTNSGTYTSMLSYFNNGGYVATNAWIKSIKFNSDGTSIFLTNRYTNTNSNSSIASNTIIKVNLATAYDITSTKTFDSAWNKTNLDASMGASVNIGNGSGITTDGKYILMVDEAASTNGYVYVWQLSTPYDLTTSVYKGVGTYTTTSGQARSYFPYRIHSESSGQGKVWLFSRATSGPSGSPVAEIDQYSTVTDYSATFPSSVTTNTSSNFGSGADPATTSYLRMVSLDGTNVLITDEKET